MLLLTDEDDFNALASVLLADCVDGRVYRLATPACAATGPWLELRYTGRRDRLLLW